MDDVIEIDIKKIIRKLLGKWYWIVGSAFVVGLATFLIFFLKPDVFESKVMVALIQPRYEANFNSDITTSDITSPTEAFIKNAVLTNEIVAQLFQIWVGSETKDVTIDAFTEQNLTVSLEGKGTIVNLSVKSDTAEKAAELANLWGELAVKQINSTYFGIDQEQVTYFETQLAEAITARNNSSNALVEFAATDISSYLGIQLTNLNAQVGDTIQRKKVLESAVFDVLGILDSIKGTQPEALVRQGDLLNFTLVQTRVYGSPVVAGLASSPMQLQLGWDTGTDELTNAEFTQAMQSWNDVLQSQIDELALLNEDLASQVTSLQSQIKSINLERSLLETDYSLNEDTYKNIKTKLEEVQLNIQTADGNAKVLSTAIPPAEALPHNTVKNTLIAAVAAGVLSVFAVLLLDWWKSEDDLIEEPKA